MKNEYNEVSGLYGQTLISDIVEGKIKRYETLMFKF